MTAITDVKDMFAVLIGRQLSNGQLLKVAASFVQVDPYHLGGWYDEVIVEAPPPIDDEPPRPDSTRLVPRDPTNEEIAQHILDTFLAFGKALHKEAVSVNKRNEGIDALNAQAELAGKEAEGDLA